MILRRPSQADKEAILEMMDEFEREHSAHDGGFGMQTTLFMKSG